MATSPRTSRVVFASSIAGRATLALTFAVSPIFAKFAEGDASSAKLIGVEIVDLARESQQNWLPDAAMMAKPFAKIRFSYDRDLVKLAKERSWLLGGFASPCKNGSFDPQSRLTDALGVRDDVGIIAFVRLQARDSSVQVASPYSYHIYVRVASFGENAPFKYDLRRQNADICFYIAARDHDGNLFETNMVRVPKEQLEQAFVAFEKGKRPLER